MNVSEELMSVLCDPSGIVCVGSDGDNEIIQKCLKKIIRMEKDVFWLDCLESAGVDNWSGINYAIELRNE